MTPYDDKPFEAFRIGDRASFTKTFTADDVAQFAALCGDEHPAHRDGDYARESRYGRPVVHGMLTASLLSTTNGRLLGTPGALSIEQTLRFVRPVFIGDTITAISEVVKLLPDQRRLRCRTTCTNQDGESVLIGDALEGK